jgi:hypothetical protein
MSEENAFVDMFGRNQFAGSKLKLESVVNVHGEISFSPR